MTKPNAKLTAKRRPQLQHPQTMTKPTESSPVPAEPRYLQRLVRHVVILPFAFLYVLLIPLAVFSALGLIAGQFGEMADRLLMWICNRWEDRWQKCLRWAKMRQPNSKPMDAF